MINVMSAENINRKPSANHLGNSSRNKKSILCDKAFLIEIDDDIITSKVERLIDIYGGKIYYSLEQNIDYLITDIIKKEKIQQTNCSKTNCSRNNDIRNMSYSDLISKANLLKIKILSAKQFQRWLKSLLKKNPTDKVACVLEGKVSLKIESIDQSQCPVFEYIPKWPDLDDTLCKRKTKFPTLHKFRDDLSDDNYSSNQYSTSEIGGMCELCDIPFMNYKEHINTGRHLIESQDKKKFLELDELINEKPLDIIFNQFVTEKKIENVNNETSSHENHIEIKNTNLNTMINHCIQKNNLSEVQLDNDFAYKDNNSIKSSVLKRSQNIKAKRKRKNNFYKKLKHKLHQNASFKDIYKVEVVDTSNSINILNDNKVESYLPPVIIRFKRIQHSKCKLIPSKNLTFNFERTKLRKPNSYDNFFYPTGTCMINTKSCVDYINRKITKISNNNIKCTFPFKKSIKILSIIEPSKIGEWIYNIPKKIQDDFFV